MYIKQPRPFQLTDCFELMSQALWISMIIIDICWVQGQGRSGTGALFVHFNGAYIHLLILSVAIWEFPVSCRTTTLIRLERRCYTAWPFKVGPYSSRRFIYVRDLAGSRHIQLSTSGMRCQANSSIMFYLYLFSSVIERIFLRRQTGIDSRHT